MDRERFDALARLFAGEGSRRHAVGVLLAAGLLAPHADLLAGPGKGAGHRKCSGQGHVKGGGKGHRKGECVGACPPDPANDKPGFLCPDGSCSCGGACCGDKCFYDNRGTANPAVEFCCTRPESSICKTNSRGVTSETCCQNTEGQPPCSCFGPGGLATSYRRPR